MIDGGLAHAKHVLIGSATEQILPFAHIQFKNRPDSIMPMPWHDEREKAAMIGALRLAFKFYRPSVANYMIISEAWLAKYDHLPRDGMVMPVDREDKKECVIVTAGDHDGARMKVWEIIRDGEGKVTDLVEAKNALDQLAGRMFNLMNDEDA
jgi:hypothetical protein